MGTKLAGLLAVVIVALVSLPLLRGEPPPGEGPAASEATRSSDPSPPAAARDELPGELETAAGPAEPRQSEAAAAEAAAPTGTDAEQVILRGRVQAPGGAPLAGLRVQLGAWQRWTEEGPQPPPLPDFTERQRNEWVGHITQTLPDGSFELSVPVPTTAATSLRIDGDPYREVHVESFNPRRRGASPLRAGVRDLGTITLAATGAVFGRVTDSSGAPLPWVEINGGESSSSINTGYAWTGPDGSFRLGHAPAGTYGISAEKDGYMDAFESPITVEVGQDTGPVDLVLETAPTIDGRVVDGNGAPLEGVRLGGWPVGNGGSYTRTTTGSDGRFALPIPQDDPYTLGARKKGYASWGDEHDHGRTFEPGGEPVRIVMARLGLSRYLVVDGTSGEPLERFAARVVENNGSGAQNRVYTQYGRGRDRDRPGGLVELSGTPAEDLAVFQASGYLEERRDLDAPAEGEAPIRIELVRGGRVTGVVLGAGGPAAEAEIVAVTGSQVRGSFREDERTRVRAVAAADGSFSLSLSAKGSHRLTFRDPAGAEAMLDGVQAAPGETTDIGTVTCHSPGAVEGVVLVPPGVDAAGIEVRVGDRDSGLTSRTGADGTFRIGRVPAGEWSVTQLGRTGVLVGGSRAKVTVPSGGTGSVTIDARDRGMGEVLLTVLLDGAPAAGTTVHLVPPEEQRAGSPFLDRLGEVDASGRCRGMVREMTDARVRAEVAGGITLIHPTATVDVLHGERVERAVRFETATLSFAFVHPGELPARGTVRLTLIHAEGRGERRTHVRIPVENGAPTGPLARLCTVTGDRWTIAGLPPGSFDVSVHAEDAAADEVRIDLSETSFTYGKPRLFERTGAVTLRAGQAAAAELR